MEDKKGLNRNTLIMNALLAGSAVLAIMGIKGKDAEILFGGIMVLWMHNCVRSVKKQKARFPFFLFHVSFFTFLLGRPLLTIVRGEGLSAFEVKKYGATFESVLLGLELIYLSLLGLWIGAWISNYAEGKIHSKKGKEPGTGRKIFFADSLRDDWKQASLFVFACSFLCEVAVTAEKVLFIVHHSYVSYYADFVSQLPYMIYVGSTFMFFSLCIWLALLPGKKQAYIVLFLYVLLRLPMAVCGARLELVLALLFAMTYFFFRDYLEGKQVWIGKWEKRLMAAGAPLGIVALGMLNYMREGVSTGFLSPISLFLDFFFKQGVTFSWLCAGLAHIAELRCRGVVSYTFGPFIDWLRHGTIARLFGAEVLVTGNTVQNAAESNLLAYHLPWLLFGKEKYLQGHGMGSCYILESFLDFRFWGVLVLSILVGAGLFLLFPLAKRDVLSRSFCLMTINGFLYMPRANALQPVNFVWRLPFWLSYAGIFVLGLILEKIKQKRKHVRRRMGEK